MDNLQESIEREHLNWLSPEEEFCPLWEECKQFQIWGECDPFQCKEGQDF